MDARRAVSPVVSVYPDSAFDRATVVAYPERLIDRTPPDRLRGALGVNDVPPPPPIDNPSKTSKIESRHSRISPAKKRSPGI